MFQEELFTRSIKTRSKLGSGCYGAVYALDDDWVVKYADKDGTLNYLEWCKTMQAAGKGMRGMPEVDTIVHLSERRYMVTMRRYDKTLRDKLRDDAGGREPSYCCQDTLKSEAWFQELRKAYLAYSSDVLEPANPDRRAPFEDCHALNFMWDKRTERYILTDPCSAEYRKQRTAFPFTMYVEEPKPAPAVKARPPQLVSEDEWRNIRMDQPMPDRRFAREMEARRLAMRFELDFEPRKVFRPVMPRFSTAEVRRWPAVMVMEAQSPMCKPFIGDEPMAAADLQIKTRLANTAEKREHYGNNPPYRAIARKQGAFQ